MTEPTVLILHGHVIDQVRKLPADSVQTIVTSPPYWGLRDYSKCACTLVKATSTVKSEPGKSANPGNSGTTRSKEPDPNCPKCLGSGRDGSLDVVWDGDPACNHEWTESRTYTERSAGATSQDAFSKPGEGNAERIREARWRMDVTCSRCGAWKGQLGLELDPRDYLRHMVQVFRELRRVLRPDGTVWLNLGDTYHGGGGGNYGDGLSAKQGGQHLTNVRNRLDLSFMGLKPKDLVGMPWRVAFALQEDGWWLRSDIIWHKLNPMPESIKSRPTKSHEYVFLLAKSEDYFYDADAIREPILEESRERGRYGFTGTELHNEGMVEAHHGKGFMRSEGRPVEFNQAGRNARTVWSIPTAPYPEAHFATFPPKLVEPCVKAGTSEKGACGSCGAPWERVSGRRSPVRKPLSGLEQTARNESFGGLLEQRSTRPIGAAGPPPMLETLGWAPTCSCMKDPCQVCGKPWIQRRIVRTISNMNIRVRDAKKGILVEKSGPFAAPNGASEQEIDDYDLDETYREEVQDVRFPACDCNVVPCTVLDPFGGSGTVGQVARELRRSAVLVEIKAEYVALAKDRANLAQKSIGDFA